MSSRIKTATMFTDEECLVQAIEDTGVNVVSHTKDRIVIGRTDYFGNQEFLREGGRFVYSHYSHDMPWNSKIKQYRSTGAWISDISSYYDVRRKEKLERLAEEERRREEERLRKLVESRRQEIIAKAKEEGYYVKETEEEGTVRLVLVRTTY